MRKSDLRVAAGLVVMGLLVLSVGAVHSASPPLSTSPTNVVKQLYDAYNRDDKAKVSSLLSPDIVWRWYGPQYVIPFAGEYRGPKGVDDFFARLHAALSDTGFGQRAFIEQGEDVAVPGFDKGTVKATGGQFNVQNLHLFKVHNGRIVQFEEYIDTGEIMEAFEPADPARGRALFTSCASCHGDNGQGRPELFASNLTGLDPAYIVRQLRAFRDGSRGRPGDVRGASMRDRANSLPGDRGLRDVAAYLASLPPAPAPGSGRPRTSGAGDLTQSCAACHGHNFEGDPKTGAPALRGLGPAYLGAQLRNYRDKLRGSDPADLPGSAMAAAARGLPDDGSVDTVAAQITNH